MAISSFPKVFAGEKHILTFQMSDELGTGETLTGTPTVTVERRRGVDPDPELIVTSSGYDGTSKNALVKINPLVRNVAYEIRVEAPTSNPDKVLVRVGLLYVDCDQPIR